MPVILKVPTVFAPPGRMVPAFVSVLPAPTSTVPLPLITPVFVNPPVFWSVAPEATLMVPDWVKVAGLTAIVPDATFSELLLVKAPLPFRVELPVVVRPTVEFTVPIDQLAALLVRLILSVLPAMVVIMLLVLPSV